MVEVSMVMLTDMPDQVSSLVPPELHVAEVPKNKALQPDATVTMRPAI